MKGLTGFSFDLAVQSALVIRCSAPLEQRRQSIMCLHRTFIDSLCLNQNRVWRALSFAGPRLELKSTRMPFFTFRREDPYPSPGRQMQNERAERWEGVPATTQREMSAVNHPSRQSQPVQIAFSASRQHSGTSPTSPTSATRLLGDHEALIPIPSYETVQSGSLVNGERATDPPSYDPKWERLPAYRVATHTLGLGSHISLNATPPSYWVGLGDPRTMAPVAAGAGGMFFNSPFQHYRLVDDPDLEYGTSRASNRICGMSVGRADLVINLSLLALCIFIWSAVVLSLNFSEPRLSGQVGAPPSTDLDPNSAFYGHPFLD